MDRFSGMSVFVRVVETGSFSAVARELNTSQPTISKQVAALEALLGVNLLTRSTRHLTLTEVGADYYERCLRILAELEAAEASARHLRSAPVGRLRVAIPVSFGKLCIVPRLHRFLARYPDIQMDLLLNDRFVDLVEEGVDLAVRLGELADSSLVARPLGRSDRLLVASPAYLKAHGAPREPQALKRHNCIVYSQAQSGAQWRFHGPDGPTVIQVRGNIQVNNGEAMLELASNGVGLALAPRWLLGEHLQRGSLQALLSEHRPPQLQIHALYPQNRHLPSKVRCFVDFLREEFAADPTLGDTNPTHPD